MPSLWSKIDRKIITKYAAACHGVGVAFIPAGFEILGATSEISKQAIQEACLLSNRCEYMVFLGYYVFLLAEAFVYHSTEVVQC